MIEILVPIITAIAKVVEVTREGLARSLEKLAADVRSGKLIPEETFQQATRDRARLKAMRDALPEEP
jgi:hypothetical protein